jgi:uncharacterized protein (UPF0276 family)
MKTKFETVEDRPGYLCEKHPCDRIDFSSEIEVLKKRVILENNPIFEGQELESLANRAVATEEALRDLAKSEQQLLIDIHHEILNAFNTGIPSIIQMNLMTTQKRLASLQLRSASASREASVKMEKLTEEIKTMTFWLLVLAVVTVGATVAPLVFSLISLICSE